MTIADYIREMNAKEQTTVHMVDHINKKLKEKALEQLESGIELVIWLIRYAAQNPDYEIKSQDGNNLVLIDTDDRIASHMHRASFFVDLAEEEGFRIQCFGGPAFIWEFDPEHLQWFRYAYTPNFPLDAF